jgi:hypothetical protein
MGDFSTVLFARPTFAEGMGRLLDFWGTLSEYNRSLTGEMADEAAFRADALALESDLRATFSRFERVKKIPKAAK